MCVSQNTFCLENNDTKRPQTNNTKHRIPFSEPFKHGSERQIMQKKYAQNKTQI
jgi:hypothetical protein